MIGLSAPLHAASPGAVTAAKRTVIGFPCGDVISRLFANVITKDGPDAGSVPERAGA